MVTIPAGSLEYILVPVTATANGTPIDPTGDTVKMAFMPTAAAPGGSDLKAATWETAGGQHYARCLVGPGGTVALTAGTYSVWVQITDSPEIPLRRAGRLTIT